MKAMFECATYAVGPRLLSDLGLAEEQYEEFLDRLRQLSQRFADSGVTFIPEDLTDAPAQVVFQTPIGNVVMSKVHMLEENGVTIAAVFSDTVGEGIQETSRHLWALRLSWKNSWVHLHGHEAGHGFKDNASYIQFAEEAVRSAMATKLILDTLSA